MHALIIACLAVGLALWAIPASAEDAEQLKRDLEQIRRRFENSQEEYCLRPAHSAANPARAGADPAADAASCTTFPTDHADGCAAPP
jgi:hypothetical protein